MNVEQELRWFFSETIGPDGDLGLISGHEAFEGICMAGAGGTSNAIGTASAAHDRAIRAIPAAARWRAVSDVLHRLSHDEQRILRAAHEDSAPARALAALLADHLGAAGPVAVVLHGLGPVHELVAGARRSEAKRARLAELRAEAEWALARSRFAFWRGIADLHETRTVPRRRRLTEALTRLLRGVA